MGSKGSDAWAYGRYFSCKLQQGYISRSCVPSEMAFVKKGRDQFPVLRGKLTSMINNNKIFPVVTAHTCNPSTQKSEADGSLWGQCQQFPGQPKLLHKEPLSQKTKINQPTKRTNNTGGIWGCYIFKRRNNSTKWVHLLHLLLFVVRVENGGRYTYSDNPCLVPERYRWFKWIFPYTI